MSECKCDFRTKMLGDGCEYCHNTTKVLIEKGEAEANRKSKEVMDAYHAYRESTTMFGHPSDSDRSKKDNSKGGEK